MLGKLVKKQRIKKGFTQQELGDRIGVTHAAISKLEKHGFASKQILIAIARVLDSDFGLDWLEEHFKKYPELSEDKTMKMLKLIVKETVKEEFNKEKNIMKKLYSEREVNTEIPCHKEKKKNS